MKLLLFLLKAVAVPLTAVFILGKFNLFDFITFIPEDHRFDVGLTIYMAILESVILIVEDYIQKSEASISCIFYLKDDDKNPRYRPVVSLKSENNDVAYIKCHIKISGNLKKLRKTKILLDLPKWVSTQVNQNDNILSVQKTTLQWNFSNVLPAQKSNLSEYMECDLKIPFIKQSNNHISIDLNPKIDPTKRIDFKTNGLTIRNEV